MYQRIFAAMLLGVSVAAGGLSLNAYAEGPGGNVTIVSPKDGAMISANSDIKVEFNVKHSADGNHLHFYVDNGDPTIVREWSGTITLPGLSAGKHEICIKEATAAHALTGLEKCVTVEAK